VKTVCITIPCLNEEKALGSNLPRLVEHLRGLTSVRWEVVVVDNGSTDGTQAVVRQMARHYGEVSLLVQAKRGRGNAIRLAWQQSGPATVLAYMDADLSVDITQTSDLVEPILEGQADVVYGNRFDPRSFVKRSVFRELLSRTYRTLARAMVGREIHDFQCGFKAIRAACRDALLGDIKDGQWFFDTELLALGLARGYRVQGIPVRWQDRDETRVCFAQTIWSDLVLLTKLRRELAAMPETHKPCYDSDGSGSRNRGNSEINNKQHRGKVVVG
jgi:glycosyltransferase involved in cell wall biosynthesis